MFPNHAEYYIALVHALQNKFAFTVPKQPCDRMLMIEQYSTNYV